MPDVVDYAQAHALAILQVRATIVAALIETAVFSVSDLIHSSDPVAGSTLADLRRAVDSIVKSVVEAP